MRGRTVVDDRRFDPVAGVNEYETHPVVIGGTDRFMSGWGEARGGTSVAGWACRPEDAKAVLAWVESRGDMKRVRYLGAKPRGTHVHIYVVDETHPAVERLYAFRRETACPECE